MPEPLSSPSSAYAAVTDTVASSSQRIPFFKPGGLSDASNAVCTSRYTWWNFLPVFLFQSFTKTANVYFLLVGVFQAIPSISPTGGVPTQLFPLVAVVLIDAVFTGHEDYRRHKDDARANAAITHVLGQSSNKFIQRQWQEVRIGDVVRITNHETVPADAVLLSTESDLDGVCYVETKSLDGESNLKLREAPKPTRQFFGSANDFCPNNIHGYVDTELPNADVHQFSGTLVLSGQSPVPLSIKNVLLRGSKLRNADAAYGLVVNVGVDCKVMRGSTEIATAKQSSLDVLVNRQVRIVVILLMLVCIVGAATDNSSLANLQFATAFVKANSVDKTLFESLAYYLTILCDLVPITLYVTITVVRAFQSYFMSQDLMMYDPTSDTPLMVRSMQLNEQLGQITHVFADKTGTLTCNDMVLRKCTVHGTKYEDLGSLPVDLHTFWRQVALCHSVLIEHGSTDTHVEYSAASPDEQALVLGARDCGGVTFVGRGPETLTLRLANGENEVYHVLEVFEFNSTRKRMTVVVQKEGFSDHVVVLTKGSDSVLFQRLALEVEENVWLRDQTKSHLTSFAHDGLRTLVFAHKTMTWDEWQSFHTRYHHARADLRHVEAQCRGLPNDIETLQDELERGLDLIGATAIEDRLQDGVPETIAKLRVAGVAVWMLTGDMLETAVNVGLSCHLLDDNIKCHIIRSTQNDQMDTQEAIVQQLDDVYDTITHHVSTDHGLHDIQHAIVIDGASLLSVLGEDTTITDDDGAQRFLRTTLLCRAVIACRVSPLQKAQLVELVKHNVPDAHTLAIGDGANDVPMLRTAHVGVGIAGQEGRQAVNSSDYAFAQFRFLQPLLFVHGRWNYNRVADLIGYTFYKNIVYSLSIFWYCLATTSYSGQMLYSPMIQNFYNLIFTVLPIALYAIQDRDLPSRECALRYPALYQREARRRAEFTHWTFWTWVAKAVIDSIALYLVILASSFGVMQHGETIPLTVLWSLGWTILIAFVTARYCLLVHTWTLIEVGGVVFSLGSMIGIQVLFDGITWSGEDFNTYAFPWLLGRPQLWLGIVFAIVAILLKDVVVEVYARRFRPQVIDLVHEDLQKKRPEEKLLVDDDLEIGVETHDRISLARLSSVRQ